MRLYWMMVCIAAPLSCLASGEENGVPSQAVPTAAHARSRTQNRLYIENCGLRNVFMGQPFRNESPPTWNSSTVASSSEDANKVVGGSPTYHGAHPWQAQILVELDDYWYHICGGAIISEYHVLTAAHCVWDVHASAIRLKVGGYRLDQAEETEQLFHIEQVVIHPNYLREGEQSNDIAVLKVFPNSYGGFVFNHFVQPICLALDDEDIYGAILSGQIPCTITGWGMQIPDDPESLSNVLLEARVTVMEQRLCKNFMQDETYVNILPGMLCAGPLRTEGDACGGDSGGPLSCQVHGRFYLYGIVSWGIGCGLPGMPGVYSRVSYYRDWIELWVSALS